MNSPRNHSALEPLLPPFVWWLTTIGWAATIYCFSTSAYGGALTRWMVQGVLDFLHISVSPATFLLLHHSVRKVAHLTEYAIFGLLLYGSFSGGRDFSWSGRRAVAALAVAAMYSLSDEFHQLFVPGRGASLGDCGLDTLGTTLGILLLYARARLLPAKASSTAAVEASAAEK